MPSLVEIGQVVLEKKKMLDVYKNDADAANDDEELDNQ